MKHGDCWFNLPDGQTARELEVSIPVKGRILMPASAAVEMDDWRDILRDSMQKRGWTVYATLDEMLKSCLSGYERIAADALEGAKSVRDDMLVMLRAVILVAESIVDDHLNHGQKNERLRGLIGVLERSVQSLRAEQFSFRDNVWRRERDLFRWDTPERELRAKLDEAKGQIKFLAAELAKFEKAAGVESESQAPSP